MALTPSAETPTTKATSGDAAANATTGQGSDAVTGEQVGHEQQAVAVSRSRTMDEHDRGITNLAQVHDPAVVELVVPWSALVAAGHRLDRTCGREYRHRCEDSGYSRCSEMTAARSHTHTRNVAPFHGQVIRASPEILRVGERPGGSRPKREGRVREPRSCPPTSSRRNGYSKG